MLSLLAAECLPVSGSHWARLRVIEHELENFLWLEEQHSYQCSGELSAEVTLSQSHVSQ